MNTLLQEILMPDGPGAEQAWFAALTVCYPHATTLHKAVSAMLGSMPTTAQAVHQTIVDYYIANLTPNTDWHSLADDGYLYDHLAGHLAGSGQHQALFGLFEHDAWMHARITQYQQNPTAYLADIETAREVLNQYQGAENALVTEARLGLIHDVIMQRGSAIPKAIIKRAVELGLWSVERVCAVCDFETAFELLSSESLTPEQRTRLEAHAFANPTLIFGSEWQNFRLRILLPEISPAWQERLKATFLDFYLDTPNQRHYYYLDFSMGTWASLMTDDELHRLLKANESQVLEYRLPLYIALAKQARDDAKESLTAQIRESLTTKHLYYSDALAFLTPQDVHRLYQDILTSGGFTSLACLKPYLTEGEYQDGIHTMVYRVFSPEAPENYQTAQALLDFIKVLPDVTNRQVIGHVLNFILSIRPGDEEAAGDEGDEASGFSYIDKEIHSIQASLLAALLPHLEAERRAELFGTVLELARQTRFDRDNLEPMLSLMDEPMLLKVLDIISDLPPLQEGYNLLEIAYAPHCLFIVLPYLTGELYSRTLQTLVDMILDLPERTAGFECVGSPLVDMVSAVAPLVEGETRQALLQAGLNAALKMPVTYHMNQRPQDDALGAILPLLDTSMVQYALDQYAHIKTEWSASLFQVFAPYLSPTEAETIFRNATASSQVRNDEVMMLSVCSSFIPHLPAECLKTVLDVVLHLPGLVDGSYNRVKTLNLLAPRLSEDLLAYALDWAITMGADPNRILEWKRKNGYIVHEVDQPVSDETRRFRAGANQHQISGVFVAFARYWKGALVEKAWHACETPERSASFRDALIQLSLNLDDAHRVQMIEAVLDEVLKKKEKPDESSGWIFGRFDKIHPVQALTALIAHCDYVNPVLYPRVLQALFTLKSTSFAAQILPHVDTETRARIIEEAIGWIEAAYPWERAAMADSLLDYLTDDQFNHVLELILSETKTTADTDTYIKIAQGVRTETHFDLWLASANRAADAHKYTGVMRPIIPYLPEHRLRQFIQHLITSTHDHDLVGAPPPAPSPLEIESGMNVELRDYYRGWLIAEAAPVAPDDLVEALFEAACTLRNAWSSSKALLAVCPRLPAAKFQQAQRLAVRSLAEIEIKTEFSEILNTLMKLVDGAMVTEVIQAALAMTNMQRRTAVMIALAPLIDDLTPIRAGICPALHTQIRAGHVYGTLANRAVFSIPLFTVETLQTMAELISEMRDEWHWL